MVTLVDAREFLLVKFGNVGNVFEDFHAWLERVSEKSKHFDGPRTTLSSEEENFLTCAGSAALRGRFRSIFNAGRSYATRSSHAGNAECMSNLLSINSQLCAVVEPFFRCLESISVDPSVCLGSLECFRARIAQSLLKRSSNKRLASDNARFGFAICCVNTLSGLVSSASADYHYRLNCFDRRRGKKLPSGAEKMFSIH